MELLILIPIALIGLFIWMVFTVASLRGRVQSLEDTVAVLRSRVQRLEDQGVSAPPVTPATPEGSPLGTLIRRREERAAESLSGSPIGVPAEAGVSQAPPPLAPVSMADLAPAISRELRPTPDGGQVAAAVPGPIGAPKVGAPEATRPAWQQPLSQLVRGGGGFNWEQFMGVKLFAWVGGFALFLAVAFFVKYSFDRGWISPELRVASGFLVGIGLLIGGVLLKRKEYAVTAHALCGTGVVILYAVSFAAHATYGLISNPIAFVLMILVTVSAFLLAVRLPAMVVAILGLLGGFLTPPLLSTGVDNPLGLFGYIAILDVGLVAVALKRRWHFLVVMAAAGTVLMQIGWAAKFFAAEKVLVALTIFTLFNAIFLGALLVANRLGRADDWLAGPAVGLPLMTFAFTFWLLGYAEIAARPGVLFVFLLVADLPLLVIALKADAKYALAHVAAGAAAFLVLAAWTGGRLTTELLNWALGGYLLFAALHTVFPIVHARLRPGRVRVWVGHAFPPLALVLIMLPMLRELTMPWLVWPVVLLVNVLAIGLALLSGAVLGVLAMVVLTVAVTAVWLLSATTGVAALPELLIVAGGFAVFFFIIGLGFGEKMLAKLETASGGTAAADAFPAWLSPLGGRREMLSLVPAVSAILPFLLLIMAVARLPLANPTPVFGLALLLVALLLVLARRLDLDGLVPVGLACVLALEYVWHGSRFTPETAGITVMWNVGFLAVFTVFPFVFREALAQRILPWVASALAGPLHFFLVYRAVKLAWPNEAMGLLPAAFAIPAAAALVVVARTWVADSANRLRLLAWFGGATLFFITLIFPIQFDRQWLTLGWALEGAALLWLFHRVPHPGLRAVGVVLLAVAFARLALNPAVFEYHARSETRIFNWFLYSYGIVTACLLWAARLLAPPRERVLGLNALPILYTLAGVLAFLLLNIEIADWFSEGANLTFQFNASFGQDMTYSIAWGLYAFLLLGIGFKTGTRGARYAGMGLLVVTIVKLFLHDLWRLGGLYRIGSLIGLAVVLMVVSFIYQRFLARPSASTAKTEPQPPSPGREN